MGSSWLGGPRRDTGKPRAQAARLGPPHQRGCMALSRGMRVSGTLPREASQNSTEQRVSGGGQEGPRFPWRAPRGLLLGSHRGLPSQNLRKGPGPSLAFVGGKEPGAPPQARRPDAVPRAWAPCRRLVASSDPLQPHSESAQRPATPSPRCQTGQDSLGAGLSIT